MSRHYSPWLVGLRLFGLTATLLPLPLWAAPMEMPSGATRLGAEPLVLRLQDLEQLPSTPEGFGPLVPPPFLAVPPPPPPPAPAPAPAPVSPAPAPAPLPLATETTTPSLSSPADGVAPTDPKAEPFRQLILDRRQRQLLVLENGQELRRFPVAVGMPGWETPVGTFKVIEKQVNPIWEHPASGRFFPPGPTNPLGSRWIGFHRDCKGRSGFNGSEILDVKGCVTAGFHGTPNRSSVGQAVSHGCVRMFDENARELFDLVRLGTPVTVLP